MDKKKSIIIGAAVVAIFTVAYISVVIFVPKQAKKTKSIQEEVKDVPPQQYQMPSLVVNLKGAGGKRYLKIEVIVEYKCKETSVVQQLFEDKKVLLTDKLIMTLSNKTVENIEGYANKEILKEEIRKEFTGILFKDKEIATISAIYYQSFLIQ